MDPDSTDSKVSPGPGGGSTPGPPERLQCSEPRLCLSSAGVQPDCDAEGGPRQSLSPAATPLPVCPPPRGKAPGGGGAGWSPASRPLIKSRSCLSTAPRGRAGVTSIKWSIAAWSLFSPGVSGRGGRHLSVCRVVPPRGAPLRGDTDRGAAGRCAPGMCTNSGRRPALRWTRVGRALPGPAPKVPGEPPRSRFVPSHLSIPSPLGARRGAWESLPVPVGHLKQPWGRTARTGALKQPQAAFSSRSRRGNSGAGTAARPAAGTGTRP